MHQGFGQEGRFTGKCRSLKGEWGCEKLLTLARERMSACKITTKGLRYASRVGTSPCKLSFPELPGDTEWPHLWAELSTRMPSDGAGCCMWRSRSSAPC